jgi:hypothetical protein
MCMLDDEHMRELQLLTNQNTKLCPISVRCVSKLRIFFSFLYFLVDLIHLIATFNIIFPLVSLSFLLRYKLISSLQLLGYCYI